MRYSTRMKYTHAVLLGALLAGCSASSEPPSLLSGEQVPSGFVAGHSGVPFSRDGDLACSYSIAISEDITNEFKIFSAGSQQKVYVESFTRVGSEAENKTFVVFDKESLYVWYDDASDGMFQANPTDELIEGFFPYYSDPSVSLGEFQVQSSCEPWNYDPAVFERPVAVKFADFSELVIQ